MGLKNSERRKRVAHRTAHIEHIETSFLTLNHTNYRSGTERVQLIGKCENMRHGGWGG
jgi:hypothetical protein